MKKALKKSVILIFLLAFAVALCGATVYADDDAESKLEEEVGDKLGELDFSELENWLNEYGDGGTGVSDNGFLDTVKDIIGGKYDTDGKALLSALSFKLGILAGLAAMLLTA